MSIKKQGKRYVFFSNDTFGELLKSYKRATTQKNELNEFYQGLENDIQVLQTAIDELDEFGDATLENFEGISDAEKTIKVEGLSVAKSLKAKYDQLVKDVATMTADLDAVKKRVKESDWGNRK